MAVNQNLFAQTPDAVKAPASPVKKVFAKSDLKKAEISKLDEIENSVENNSHM